MTSLPAPSADMTVGRQGHYAGAVSRLAAFAADVGASWGLYTTGVALLSLASELVTGRSVTVTHHQVLAIVVLVIWEFIYFTYPWAVSGKTLGMALFGLQVVTAEGGPIGPRQAVLRTLTLPLSVIPIGLGFVGIVFQRERRALHDLLVGTAVVYAWDARAARLRWMSRTVLPQASHTK
jgi:uncharacterized RDD family membrane protein YckC